MPERSKLRGKLGPEIQVNRVYTSSNMADIDIDPEDLKALPPDKRIEKLKELAAAKLHALEEAQKELEEELEETEDLIEESEEELDEGERLEEEREKEKSKDALEEIIRGEKPQNVQGTGPDYSTTPIGEVKPLYDTLHQAADNLEKLYQQPEDQWTEQDQQTYQQSKERIERAQSYKLTNEQLEEELGLASSVLNRLKYKM